MKNPPNAGLFRLIWPPEGSDQPQTKNGIPLFFGWGRAHSILLRRRKNRKCSELKMLGGRLYLHATTGSHLIDKSKNFSFLKSSSVSLFWAKKPKSRPQSTLFEFQKLNNFQWSFSRGGASEHKFEKIFFYFYLFLSSNFWNILKFLIFLKKRIWFPLELQL